MPYNKRFGSLLSTNSSTTGVLIECDPSIKSIIVSIDSANHDYIIEDLDDERVVVKENMVSMLKAKLEDVRISHNKPLTRIHCAYIYIYLFELTKHSDSKRTCLPRRNPAPNKIRIHSIDLILILIHTAILYLITLHA